MGDPSEYDIAEEWYDSVGINDDDDDDNGGLAHSDRALLGITPSTPSTPLIKEDYVNVRAGDTRVGTPPTTPERGLSHVERALLGMTPSTPDRDVGCVQISLSGRTQVPSERED